MDFALRATADADFDEIASWVGSQAECTSWLGPAIAYPFTGAQLLGLLLARPAVVPGEIRSRYTLAAQQDGLERVLGYGELIRENATDSRLGRIIVAPDARRAGHGRRLCRGLIDLAGASTSTRRIRLFVYRDNAAALRTYGGLGFTPTAATAGSRIVEMEMRLGRAAPGAAT